VILRGKFAVIGVEPAVKYSFVFKGMQTRRKGQYNAELTLSPRLYVKPLITPITAIVTACFAPFTRPVKPYRFENAPLLTAFSKRPGSDKRTRPAPMRLQMKLRPCKQCLNSLINMLKM